MKEGAQRLRPGESTKARGASVEDKHPYTHQLNWITPEGYHYVWQWIPCSVMFLLEQFFSATLFRNFSSHVNVRRDIFVFSFI